MHNIVVATKTISIDLEAYEALRRARLRENESFSKVIKRASWKQPKADASQLLAGLEALSPVTESTMAALEQAQCEDHPPEDPWD